MDTLTSHIEEVNRKGQEWAAQADTENGEFRCHAQYNTSPEYWSEFADLYVVPEDQAPLGSLELVLDIAC